MDNQIPDVWIWLKIFGVFIKFQKLKQCKYWWLIFLMKFIFIKLTNNI